MPVHPDINYSAVLPEICLAATGLGVMLYDAFAQGSRRWAGPLVLAGVLAAAYGVWRWTNLPPGASFNGMLITDPMRTAFALLFLFVTALAVLLAMPMFDGRARNGGEYFALLTFGTVGMLLVGGAGDLAMLFLGIEILSIASYALAGFRRSDLRSNEASVKYFILGSFATGFLLYGMALIYGATRTTNLTTIRLVIQNGGLTSESLLLTGAALMLVGLCFKAAAAPFHFWAPDVYHGAPTPVTAFMAAGSKAVAFVALLRVFGGLFPSEVFSLHRTWALMLAVVSVLSMVIGNAVAIVQDDIKRMLAYSSIAHAGYALLGVLVGNWKATWFYLIGYAATTLGAFAVVTYVARADDDRTNIADYAGLGGQATGAAVALAVCLLALGGLPLTAGFMGKFVLFREVWQGGYAWLVIMAVLNSAASLYYYLRPVVTMFFGEGRSSEDELPEPPWPLTTALALALAAVLYIGIVPEPILAGLNREPSAGKTALPPVER
ncbi:MAG: NADH-quinone oxidoreductase subunit N [Chloracidobacterium sp.]|nr:NADH-quinone oxidoreductase subunit N [Chloracidobacterium sp.]MDW8216130.1 NADH-quinone oxidoreductase subunit N [Acidobacteriota bacterium]